MCIPLEVNVTSKERGTTLESFSNGLLLLQQEAEEEEEEEEEEEKEEEEEEENSRERKKIRSICRFSRETIMVIMRGG